MFLRTFMLVIWLLGTLAALFVLDIGFAPASRLAQLGIWRFLALSLGELAWSIATGLIVLRYHRARRLHRYQKRKALPPAS